MNFFKPKHSPPSSSSPSNVPQPHRFLHQAFTDFQNHLSSFTQNKQDNPLFNIFSGNPFSPSRTHLESSPFGFKNCETQGQAMFPSFNFSNNPSWARISEGGDASSANKNRMSMDAIEERLAGVPVYALSNPSEEFVVVSGVHSGKSLGLFCFREADAESLLKHMKSVDPRMRQGSKVVAVALSKVFQLKLDGVAFRFIPDSSQIKNAFKERQKAGISDESFAGVPVFQSRSLLLRSQNKRYRPLFFRKEDLEKSLLRASGQQRQLNPALREGDIQVAVFEDIIQGMKDSSTSKWDDVVFIPPGFDVSTDTSKQ